MSVLETIPHEIAVDILSYLPSGDLATLSILSRRMHTISQPLLYKAPNLTCREEATSTPIHLLLRTLLDPGGKTLATYIRSLNVWWDYLDPCERCSMEDIYLGLTHECPKDLEFLVNVATPLGLHRHLQYQDVQLLLLLHLLPRLAVLHLVPGWQFSAFLKSHDMAHPTEALPLGLRLLREFKCTSNDPAITVSPATFLTILSLPCIEKIHVTMTDESYIDPKRAEAAAATSTVRNLIIIDVDQPKQSLECILKIPAALTHFTYSARRPNPKVNMEHVLQPLQHSLQSLWLEFVGVGMPIGSLRAWPVLNTLRCSLTALLGKGPQLNMPKLSDVLPVGLRELQILEDECWLAEETVVQVVDLLKQKQTAVPRLVTLAVKIYAANMTEERHHQATLSDACEAAGVALVDIHVLGGRPRRQWRCLLSDPPTSRHVICRCPGSK